MFRYVLYAIFLLMVSTCDTSSATVATMTPAGAPPEAASTTAQTSSALTNQAVYYVGRQDTNTDGVINTDDRAVLYFSRNNAEGTALSAPDTSVLQYDVNDAASLIAYTGNTATATIIDVVDSASGSSRRIEIADLTPTQIHVYQSAVWTVGLDAQSVPVLRGYDTTSGAVIGEHRFLRPNTDVSLHATGNWAVAYNASSAGLTALTLPSMQIIPFAIDAYALSAPVMSPAQPVFVIAAATDQALTDVGVYEINLNTATTTRLTQVIAQRSYNLQWSRDGQYVTFSFPNADNSAVSSSLVVNASTGAAQTLSDPQATVSVVDWSQDDQQALIARRAPGDTTQPTSLEILVPSTQQTTALNSSSISVNTVAWSPDSTAIALLGQSITNGQFGAYLINLGTGALTPLFESPDPSVSTGMLVWQQNAQAILFTAQSQDQVFSSTGTPTALYAASISSPVTVTRLSPPLVAIDTLSILIR